MREESVKELMGDEIHGRALNGTNPNIQLVRETLSLFSGNFAWPSLILALSSWAIHFGSSYLAVTGQLSLLWCCIINSICVYLTFTPMHEAAHYNISGKYKKLRWIDEIIGWVSGLIIYAPYSSFRVLHHQHHANPNHPEKDPDYFVYSSSKIVCLLRCFLILPFYYFNYLFKFHNKEGAKRADLAISIILIIAKIIVSIYIIQNGYGKELFLLWILPAFNGTFILGLTFDLIPHWPHKSRDVYLNSWIYLSPILNFLLLGQNYHLIHHLYRKIPFYKYGDVYERLSEHLKHKGVKVYGEKK